MKRTYQQNQAPEAYYRLATLLSEQTIRGEDKRGKVRDIDLTASGEVIAIE